MSAERDQEPVSQQKRQESRDSLLRVLRGVNLDPQQTSDDLEPLAVDLQRDQQLKEDVPPHHG
jgi:hypothetical protein